MRRVEGDVSRCACHMVFDPRRRRAGSARAGGRGGGVPSHRCGGGLSGSRAESEGRVCFDAEWTR